MKLKLIFFIFTIFWLSCLSQGSDRFYRVLERADVDTSSKGAIIRTIYCDIYIENLKKSLWPAIAKSEVYKAFGRDFPDGEAFLFIINNTWDKPLIFERIYILDKDSGKIYEEETFDFKPDNYIQRRFCINPQKMMQPRRLLNDAQSLEEINYDDFTVEYKFDFIAPGDRVLFFKFFNFVPQKKNIKICIVFKYNDLKKVIDFDLGLSDYIEKE